MSSSSSLFVGKYELNNFIALVDPYTAILFRESDKIVKLKPNKQYRYSSKVGIIKSRLDLLGYSLDKTKQNFNNAKAAMGNFSRKERILINKTNFNDWISAFYQIYTKKLKVVYYAQSEVKLSSNPLINLMLSHSVINDEFPAPFKYPCSDIRYFYRAFLENMPSQTSVTLDYTDLVEAEYYRSKDQLTKLAVNALTYNYADIENIIVLTEGSIDSTIIKRSLKLLYPDLSDYYYFFDFENSKPQGGAPFLVSTIQSFIASGIKNRVIAIFDNDSAAHQAAMVLSSVVMPENIKIMHLPDIEMAKNYPTIGPSGVNSMNVNKLAGGLELYLGRKALRSAERTLIPIQWTGYMDKIKQYQGEILFKNQVQEHFFSQLNICEKNRRLIKRYDWYNMHLILRKLFSQFS